MRVTIWNSKTCKNASQSESVSRPLLYQGFNLEKILSEIHTLRKSNSEKWLFFLKTKFTYTNGLTFFHKSMKRFTDAFPQYASKKFTPHVFRASQMIAEYKIEQRALKKVKKSARHSKKSLVTAKSYLSKDSTLLY